MKTFNFVSPFSDPKGKSHLWSICIVVLLTVSVYLIGREFLSEDYTHVTQRAGLTKARPKTQLDDCKNQCRPEGSEALPEGIVAKTSDLQMRRLWGPVVVNKPGKHPASLLAVAVGINQKEIVNRTVEKFLENGFMVMLFHYDNVVDGWRKFRWSDRVIHVSATNQTKWWFAKRFLHPDIVAEYDYVFLWDEDLGVEFFHPGRYLSIIRDEGLEISQPALDGSMSDVHHPITLRRKNSRMHRRFYKLKGSGRCNGGSTSPPCIGWVEMMAPVFSRAAWRCTWYLIQNDLIHAWGLDVQLGYCAQGDRTRNVGVVDSEYIIHLDVHTLGSTGQSSPGCKVLNHSSQTNTPLGLDAAKGRLEVRRQSYKEMQIFNKRWINATKEDKCWVDPFQEPPAQASP